MRLNPNCDVLANLSGGLDSVYGVWRLLEDGRHPLIHHCHLGGNKRLPWETRATERSLAWFRTMGLTNFDYIESRVELPAAVYRSRMRDPDLIMMISGQIVRDRPHVRELAYFNNREDTSTRHPRTRRRREQIFRFWSNYRNVTISRPIQNLTKADIVHSIPGELFDIAHWCRFPSPQGETCHRCIPCKKVDAAIWEGCEDAV